MNFIFLIYLMFVGATDSTKLVALTFDDGPWPIYTREILDTLDKYQIKATFFIIGQHLERNPALLKEEVKRGHLIGNHTYTHPNLTKLSNEQIAEEILKTEWLIDSICPNACSKFFRPPCFAISGRTACKISDMGYLIIFRTIDPSDWYPGISKQEILNYVLKNCTKDREIICLHDGGGDRSKTVEILPKIIEELQAKGYKFVTLPEIFAK